MDRFTQCALYLINHWERGYVNDPQDPGGETKYGISKRAHPDVDIANLTVEDAISLYRDEYWTPISGDSLPKKLDLYMMNAAIMSGPVQAVKILQKTLGVVQDGVLGPRTLTAANKLPPGRVSEYMANYSLFLTRLANFPHDGHGWENRLFDLAQNGV